MNLKQLQGQMGAHPLGDFLTEPSNKPSSGVKPGPAAGGDADGIDDLLVMQPWLQE